MAAAAVVWFLVEYSCWVYFFLIGVAIFASISTSTPRGREKEKNRGWWGGLLVRYKQCGIVRPCDLHVEQLPGFK